MQQNKPVSTPIRRREIIKKAAAATGMFFFAGVAQAATKAKGSTENASAPVSLEGEWLKGDAPCAIFQQGKVLLLVNERGEVGTGQVINSKELRVLGGAGWLPGLVGKISKKGNSISWGNEDGWVRSDGEE